MSTKILFVDDEPMILQGLQRMLRNMRQEWDMSFVDSGAKALELLAQTPFDVVVSDMRMPGMNGAELLNQVMRRHPKTIRLILSGHADQDLVMQCVGSTHQYLSKPCDPAHLKATIERAVRLESSLQSDKLKEIASKMDRLPSVPSLYVEIVETLQNPDADLDDVAAIISRDPGMTAQILKLVNSAFFGLSRQISNPAEAVSYVGLDTIKSLVLAIEAFSQFQDVPAGDFSINRLWNHSLECAAAAKKLCQLVDAPRAVADQAFVAGILHDVGKLVMAANFPDLYSNTLKLAADQNISLAAAEIQTFGADHSDLGGFLLGLWGLPVPVVEAIAMHHHPIQSIGTEFDALTAVHVANVLTQAAPGTNDEDIASALDRAHLVKLGLWDRVPEWIQSIRITPPSETGEANATAA